MNGGHPYLSFVENQNDSDDSNLQLGTGRASWSLSFYQKAHFESFFHTLSLVLSPTCRLSLRISRQLSLTSTEPYVFVVYFL